MRQNLIINSFQDYIFTVVEKIYNSNKISLKAYGNPERPGKLVREGDRLALPAFADALDSLAREEEDLFYRGEIAAGIV